MKYNNEFEKKLYPKIINYNIPISLHTSKYSIDLLLFNRSFPDNQKIVLKHEHKMFEIHYCISGEGSVEIDDKKIPVTSNSFYFVPPGIYHSQYFDSENQYSEYVLMFNIVPLKSNFAAPQKSNIFDNLDAIIDIIMKHEFFWGRDKNNVITLLNLIADNIGQNGNHVNLSYFCFMIMSALVQTISNMADIPLTPCENIANGDMLHSLDSSGISISNDSQRLAYLDSIFRSHNSYISAETVASELFISVRQLDRICHKYYNMSFKQKYRENRMLQAVELLLHFDKLSIEEISHRLGFSSSKYFTKIFKEHYGVSPTIYRKRNRKTLN